MTQEERQELLVALCGYLPYGIKGLTLGTKTCTLIMLMSDGMFKADTFVGHITSGQFKPYLRLMSSMTEEEKKEYNFLTPIVEVIFPCDAYPLIDWLNAHHFDYRGLIKKGFALEAPKDMYNTKTE